ncbi:hypothetical protein SASPL_132365 [Salvia splendens]|uniref:Disease resistance protein RPM1 n=1 Tax=Salvia splendens TaxID=180675 RepID=A0A8X8ZI49_SALSN|nr:probable disease resistance protein At1g58602 [Salvia splendens]XP_042009917.1 probable disease resistance protein At1g58602 [Salvia splendens]KAG6404789.1 hypothetical protein SASPL_132365 [Salvia splendens]
MAEAAVLEMIQDLKSLHVTCADTRKQSILKRTINELTETLDFWRDLEMEERSKLECFIAELVKLARDVIDVEFEFYSNSINSTYENLVIQMKTTKVRMKSIGYEEEGEIVVGLEKDVKKLLEKNILNKLKDFQILCIKGMIGIGKTSLARQLYKAGAGQFERQAWVCVSSDMRKDEVLMRLIQQMVPGYKRRTFQKLSDKDFLRQNLEGLSCFVVLDNLSKKTHLDYILDGLPSRGCTGSRLLLTSRIDLRSANMLQLTSRFEFRTVDVGYTHEMNALDSDKSWKLFLKTIDKVTSVENKFSKEMERKGKEMLKKCWGLPLAIINVARQKATQRLSGIEWEALFESIELSDTLKLLEPMYHQLDDRIKPEFVHLSLFKEDAILRDEKLDQIWAVNGLGFPKLSSVFARRSILRVVKRLFSKTRFRLHPLLHMISIRKAEEEMGLEILSSNGNSRPSQNARHRVIHCGRDKFDPFTNELSKQLISLIFHGGGSYLDDTSSSYWESFESLKILDMEDFGVKTLPETIGTLVELQYLGLRNNYIQEIPQLLAELKKLEVLDISQNFMVEVPDIILEMNSLRDVHMSNVIFRESLKVATLCKLRTLEYISIYDWTYERPSFRRIMYDFETLGFEEVDENSDVDTLFASLAQFPYFINLFLRGFRYRSMPCLDKIGAIRKLTVLKLDGRIGRLPSADSLPERIFYISLVNTCLDEDPMPTLEKLIFLSRLKLRNAYTGREMVIQHGGFPRLKVLCINELWNLRKIRVDEDAMLIVVELEINSCPHLETLPERIQRMSELKKFKMVTTKHIATKIRNAGLTSEISEEDIDP